MAKQVDSLSVFFPAYNEEANIEKTVLGAKKVLEAVAKKWEIIVVNDGSKDKTEDVVKKLTRKDKRIRLITHMPNRGYGAAVKSGLYAARYPWITFTDSDGQFDFSELTKFVEKQQLTKADLIIGYYKKRQVPLFRKLNTYVWQLIVYLLFGLKVRDIDCAFKYLSKKVIDTIEPLESERGAFISSEFLIKAQKHKFTFAEVGVSHYPRKAGRATGSDLNVIIQSFKDLFRLWLKLR